MINTIPALEEYAADLQSEIDACGPEWTAFKRGLVNDLADTNRRIQALYGRA